MRTHLVGTGHVRRLLEGGCLLSPGSPISGEGRPKRATYSAIPRMKLGVAHWGKPEMVVAVYGRRRLPTKLRNTNTIAQREKDERDEERCGGAFVKVFHDLPPRMSFLSLELVSAAVALRDGAYIPKNFLDEPLAHGVAWGQKIPGS
jgi:hypothetical protein